VQSFEACAHGLDRHSMRPLSRKNRLRCDSIPRWPSIGAAKLFQAATLLAYRHRGGERQWSGSGWWNLLYQAPLLLIIRQMTARHLPAFCVSDNADKVISGTNLFDSTRAVFEPAALSMPLESVDRRRKNLVTRAWVFNAAGSSHNRIYLLEISEIRGAIDEIAAELKINRAALLGGRNSAP